jgi:hypothetical protein
LHDDLNPTVGAGHLLDNGLGADREEVVQGRLFDVRILLRDDDEKLVLGRERGLDGGDGRLAADRQLASPGRGRARCFFRGRTG